jgi:hypothetical protein
MTSRRLRATFNEAADLYDLARPSYPEQLYHDFDAATGGRRPVEIGCGTGKATFEEFFVAVQDCYERSDPAAGLHRRPPQWTDRQAPPHRTDGRDEAVRTGSVTW